MMTSKSRPQLDVSVDRIFLDLNNPRHEPFQTQAEAIAYLCQKEEVPQLARDIAEHGLSPFDRFGITALPGSDSKNPTYLAAEGNRRVCALKLLADPDLAPPERRALFEELASKWQPISSVPCVVFKDADDLHLWLGRRHHGLAGGVGQKPWNSEQKTRHAGGTSRNTIAQAFLDYAEAEGFITSTEREKQITTVQRFLSNPIMRETMGLDTTSPDELKRNRPEDDFEVLSKKFIADLLNPDPGSPVSSRKKAQEIRDYGRSLAAMPGQSHKRVEPVPIQQPSLAKGRSKGKPKPQSPKEPTKLPWRDDIAAELAALGNWKLTTLYHSICDVPLKGNVTLLSIGCWAFLEVLTAAAGRTNDFGTFLQKTKLKSLGIKDDNQIKAVRQCIERIQHYGNTSKHHVTSASFNGEQLYNDMTTLGDTILKIVEAAKQQPA